MDDELRSAPERVERPSSDGPQASGGGQASAATAPAPSPREDAQSPPSRGLPLGLRLSLATSLLVLVVVGSLMLIQQRREAQREEQALQELLEEALSPLAAQVEQAADMSELLAILQAFQQAYVWRGRADHQVDLRDADGEVVASSLPGSDPVPRPSSLQAVVRVTSALLPQGAGTLTVWQDDAELKESSSRRWRLWWLNIGVTILCTLLALQVAHHYLVARPLNQLLDGVRKLRMGYWSAMQVPRGAWEMRWLAWHFRKLGEELEETVRRLVEAERRALPVMPLNSPGPGTAGCPGASSAAASAQAISRAREALVGPRGLSTALAAQGKGTLVHELLRQYLRDKCRQLEQQDPRAPETRACAREVWDKDAAEAERLGDIQLKARLEDAALRVLDPAAFARVASQLAAFQAAQRSWARERQNELRSVLERHGVPYVSLSHRVKHIAGIWRKMVAKNLELEQVYDIFAFRIIVPEERDCYLALRVIHEDFEPQLLLFKDYIANPKPSGYQSLHTYVQSRSGSGSLPELVFEVQIRSVKMHRHAEADHWRYKIETRRDAAPRSIRSSLRRLWMAMLPHPEEK